MELSKKDTQKAKGVAIIGMVMLHLFCRLGELPYKPLIYVGKNPLIYYLGLFGDICVPIYCFCSGYAHILLSERDNEQFINQIPKRIIKILYNYWIVVVMFSFIAIIVKPASGIPGSFTAFLGNFFLYRLTYNGAWWFIIIYILLLLLSPFLIKIVLKHNSLILFCISGIVYFISYLFRFKLIIEIPLEAIDWIWQQVVLLGTSQFTYTIGAICYKEKYISKLRTFFGSLSADKSNIKSMAIYIAVIYILPIVGFYGHCIVQSLIVAPITAMITLISLFVVNLPPVIDKLFLFMGKHSTNIWLTHMFFYTYIFENMVFYVKYPVLILIYTLTLCLLTSHVINLLMKNIGIIFENKKNNYI